MSQIEGFPFDAPDSYVLEKKVRGAIMTCLWSAKAASGLNVNDVMTQFFVDFLTDYTVRVLPLILNSPPAAADTPSNDSQSK